MRPNCPNGFSFEKISTFISLPIIQDSGNNGHEQQNTNKFFIFILISKIDTSVFVNKKVSQKGVKKVSTFNTQ